MLWITCPTICMRKDCGGLHCSVLHNLDSHKECDQLWNTQCFSMTLVKWCLLSSGVTVSCISHVSTLPILLKQIHLKADHSRDAEDDARDSSVGGRNGEGAWHHDTWRNSIQH